ncbi:unnamed protein product [Spirodela intermedia]|uniref:F-box domain-containing protein n=1 Tax=Spirodela intermedia TaxID=51605 RepID=A0A7I8IYL5_SPIIN|nr:unnamed protein product [Spirodela intermedia]CAA6662663.1 unnamed protein product [Spirodela intermedia]
MADARPASKRWEEMEIDGLVKIFKELNMIEMAPVSQVCRSWRLACADPLLWRILDLGRMKSNFIPTRASPFVWVDDRISSMIFHFDLYMKDEHLNYIADRCPHLRRLVLPAWNRITRTGICQAIRRWEELESLTMPTIQYPPYIMEEISRSCKNFSQLKIMGSFDVNFASSIHSNLPTLKVLSVRCSRLSKEALLFILDRMENLEVLNISHCLIVEGPASSSKRIMRELDAAILGKASRLREFAYCLDQLCVCCRRMNVDEGLMRWYRYEDWFWRKDEVSSLDLGDHGKLFDDWCVNQVCG